MPLYYYVAGMRIERCREDCYDLSILQATVEQLSHKFLRWKINLTQVYYFPICLYLRNISWQRSKNGSLHTSRKLARQYWSANDMGECWQNVNKTFVPKKRRYGVQSAGGRFGTFCHSVQLFDCNWMKGVKNCKWCLSSTVLCLQFVLIYASSNLFIIINKINHWIYQAAGLLDIYLEKEQISYVVRVCCI